MPGAIDFLESDELNAFATTGMLSRRIQLFGFSFCCCVITCTWSGIRERSRSSGSRLETPVARAVDLWTSYAIVKTVGPKIPPQLGACADTVEGTMFRMLDMPYNFGDMCQL